MTRINLIPVHLLTDQHLLAEHREIKRIPNMINLGKYNLDNIPEKFCLGNGHVKFFYNKIKFLYIRYINLYLECERRGFDIQDYSYNFIKCKSNFPELYNDYKPTEEEIEISKQRILEKIKQKHLFYRYYGKIILTFNF